ncbi:hypothetical protein CsSME_00004102 [Camellia sinensis var. sinensis]
MVFFRFSLAKKSNSMISGGCNSTIAECLAGGGEEVELLMESETTRRFLTSNQQKITYSTLQRPVVCNTMLYGDCIGQANNDIQPCTTYN